jgi:hypothetical protein
MRASGGIKKVVGPLAVLTCVNVVLFGAAFSSRNRPLFPDMRPVTVSAGGKHVAFSMEATDRETEVYVVDVATWQTVAMSKPPKGQCRDSPVAWCPDGTRLLGQRLFRKEAETSEGRAWPTSYRTEVFILSLADGSVATVKPSNLRSLDSPLPLPGGQDGFVCRAMTEASDGAEPQTGVYAVERRSGRWQAQVLVADNGDRRMTPVRVTGHESGYRVLLLEHGPPANAEATLAYWGVTVKNGTMQKELLRTLSQREYGEVSPDGRWSAVLNEDSRELHLVPLDAPGTAARTLQAPDRQDYELTVAWSPGSRRLLLWDHGWFESEWQVTPGRFFLVDPEKMSVSRISVQPVTDLLTSWAAWLSEEELVVSAEACLWTLNPETGLLKKVWEAPSDLKREYLRQD